MTFLYFTWCPQVQEPPQSQFAFLSGSGISPRYGAGPGPICPFIGFGDFSQVHWLCLVNLPFLLAARIPQVQRRFRN